MNEDELKSFITSTGQVRLMPAAGRIVKVRTGSGPDEQVALFPSVGEYPLYDDHVYGAFLRSPGRNSSYGRAIAAAAPGKVAVDIGTGRDAIWAIACARAGASHVYAIEEIPAVAAQAAAAVHRAALSGQITIISSRSDHAGLPEPAGLCVSEIVGNIAGAEGVQAFIADARKRLCTVSATFIPHRCATVLGAISFGHRQQGVPSIAVESLHYLRQAFEVVGHPFDVRFCLAGPAATLLISSTCEVERLSLADGGEVTGHSDRGSVVINKTARLHGLMLWARLWCAENSAPYDCLAARELSWAPVYAPLSLAGISVAPGDRLEFTFHSMLSDDGVHPDYRLSGVINQSSGNSVPVEWNSSHHGMQFRATETYRFLFPE